MRRPSLMRERLRLLNSLLPPMAARSRDERIREGIINLALGAGMFGISFIPAFGPPNDVRPFLWTYAAFYGISGALTLLWIPARERLGTQYEQMPMRTAAERRARVLFGERALDEMAAESTVRRTLSALGNAALPIATLAVLYRDPIFNGTPYTLGPSDWLLLGFSGVQVVVSLVQLFMRTEEQQARDAYRAQIRLLRSEREIEGEVQPAR